MHALTTQVDTASIDAVQAVPLGDERAGLTETSIGGAQPAYRGGRVDRHTQHWQPGPWSADQAIAETRSVWRPRCRDLCRNTPDGVALKRTLVHNVIDGGIGCAAAVRHADGSREQEFNEASDELFERWAEQEFDAGGRFSFDESQQIAFGETVEAGEVLLVRSANPDRSRIVPLQYQLTECEQLAEGVEQTTQTNGNEIRDGVEVDRAGRHVAYHLYERHPDDQTWNFFDPKRVPADRVIHLFLATRPSQTRGIGWFAPILGLSWDEDRYFGNEMQTAANNALLAAFLSREHGGDGGIGIQELTDDGATVAQMGGGAIFDMGPTDKVEVVESKRPTGDARPWLEYFDNKKSAGIGCSFLRFSRDYSATNYSSARAAHLDDNKSFRVLQRWVASHLVMRVRRDFTRQAIALGRLKEYVTPDNFVGDPEKWLACEPRLPGWEQVDGVKETQAALMRIAGGLSNFEIELDRLGRRRKSVHEKLAEEWKEIERLNVPIDLTRAGNLSTGLDQGGSESPEEPPANPRGRGRTADRSPQQQGAADE